VDRFLEGKPNRTQIPPHKKGKRGAQKKWNPDECIHYNFPVPVDLDERFSQVVDAINEEFDYPLPKSDFQRLAIEEFIQRRPEYMIKEATN
jgi:hypothetical protein